MVNKVVIIQPALAPYRIDLFNEISCMCNEFIIYVENTDLIDNPIEKNLYSKYLKNTIIEQLNSVMFGNRRLAYSLVTKLISNKPDIIITSEVNLSSWIALFITKIINPRAKFYTFFDDSYDGAISKSRVNKLMRSFFQLWIDGLFVPSEFVLSAYSAPCYVVPIVHNPYRFINRFNLQESSTTRVQGTDSLTLIFVGRLISEKNVLTLIEAIRGLDIVEELKIVGIGPLRQTVEVLANEESKVNYIGYLQGQDLYNEMIEADVLVLPSLWEPFGVVINEAQIVGKRVICSNKVGAQSLVSTDTGTICTADLEGIRRAILNEYHIKKSNKQNVGYHRSVEHFEVVLNSINRAFRAE